LAFYVPPIWDPSQAASAGATFAGVLGALVIALTFQINSSPGDEGNTAIRSKTSAPITLVLLLIAAYTYVVLSGTETNNELAESSIPAAKVAVAATTRSCAAGKGGAHSTSCVAAVSAMGALQHHYNVLRVSAAMFAIGGSYLGLGAIALTFTLALVAREHAGNTQESQNVHSTNVLFATSIVVAILALVWGYRDAREISFTQPKDITIGQFLLEYHAVFGVLLGLIVGVATGWCLRRLARADEVERSDQAGGGYWRTFLRPWGTVPNIKIIELSSSHQASEMDVALVAEKTASRAKYNFLAAVMATAYISVPFVFYLRAEGKQTNFDSFDTHWLTVAMLTWITIGIVTFLVLLYPRSRRDSGIPVPEVPLSERMALTISEVAVLLGISRNQAYGLVDQGSLPSIRLGVRLMVTMKALNEFLDQHVGPSATR
jgi:excisionase family DNA binding protein